MKWHAILGILAVFCDLCSSIRNGPPYETITFQDKIQTADYTLNGAQDFNSQLQSVLSAIGKQNAQIEVVPATQITSRFQNPQYEVIDVYEISQNANKNGYQNQYSNNNYRPASPKNDVYAPDPPPHRQGYHHPPPPPEDDDYPPPPPPPDGHRPPHRPGHRHPPPPPPPDDDDDDDYYDPPPPPPPPRHHRGPRGPRGPPPHAQAHGHYGHPHGGPPGHNKRPPPPPEYDHYDHHPGGPPHGRPNRPPPLIFEDQNYGDRGQGHRPGFNHQPGYDNLGEQNIDLGQPEQRPHFNKPNKMPGNVVGFIEGNFPVILLNDNEIRRK